MKEEWCYQEYIHGMNTRERDMYSIHSKYTRQVYTASIHGVHIEIAAKRLASTKRGVGSLPQKEHRKSGRMHKQESSSPKVLWTQALPVLAIKSRQGVRSGVQLC